MPTKTIIQTTAAPAAVGPYSQAVRVGDLLFCAGQIPLDPATGQLVAGDIRAQTRQVLQNIQAILTSQKLTLKHVVKTTVFLTDLADFAAMNQVYAEFFKRNPPVRTCVEVTRLPAGAHVEITCIAVLPDK